MAVSPPNDPPQMSVQIPGEEEMPLRHSTEEDADILKERQSFVDEEEKGVTVVTSRKARQCRPSIRIGIGIITAVLIIVLCIIGVVAHYPTLAPRAAGHFNETLYHLTDGLIDDEPNNNNNNSDGPRVGEVSVGIAGSGIDSPCIQRKERCTHTGNAVFGASTEYGGSYSAIRAFQSYCFSWCSALINADNSEKQWIGMQLKEPRKVDKISFRGSDKYPDNTPTVYELQAFDTKTQKWERIMSGWHPKSNRHKLRTHTILRDKAEKFYQDFRLVVYKTIWMEKDVKSGYVQLSNVELCWDPSISKPSKLEGGRKNDADEHSESPPIDESASTTSFPSKTGAETPDAGHRTMEKDGSSPDADRRTMEEDGASPTSTNDEAGTSPTSTNDGDGASPASANQRQHLLILSFCALLVSTFIS